MSTCNIGIQNSVEQVLNNQPWFNYKKEDGIVEVLDSPNGKINQQNSIGVARTVATSINKLINDGYKNIGDIAYVTFLNNRGVVRIEPTKGQLELINAIDEEDFIKFQEQIEEELQQEEFKKLAEESNTYINEEGEIVPTEEDVYFQLPSDKNEPASPEVIKLLKDFIKQIGVDYQKVEKIVVNGEIVDANGIANTMQKLIQVVEGKEDVALPEEAMHFAVEIIQQTNPKLFQDLLKGINGESILDDVFAQYSKNKEYQKDGKPDIIKLKKEAIAKALVDRLNSDKVMSWWDKIVNFFKKLFYGAGLDEMTMKILSGEYIGSVDDIKSGDIYYQLTDQDTVLNRIKDISNRISKEDNGVNDEGETKQSYFINGKAIKNRVTDFVKEWYNRIFKGDQTEFQKAIASLNAEEGTKGHKHFEVAQDTMVDPETNLLRDEFTDDDLEYIGSLDQVDKDVYMTLKENLRERLLSFPEGTKFLSEVAIYDGKDTAGTVDFMAITPEGKVNILDWKFMSLNVDKYDDIPWYKVRAWNMQMDKYRYILNKNYGVRNEDFGQTRMIPILAVYTQADYKNEVLPKLVEIKIGSANVENINEDILLPVGVEREKTGDRAIDTLLEKFNSIYKKLSEEKVSDAEKSAKAEQLNALYRAIRHLQIKKDITPLINQGKILNKQVDNFIKKYNNEIKGKDKEEVGKEKINAFAGMIRLHIEALLPYLDLAQFEDTFDSNDAEFENLLKTLRDTTGSVASGIRKLEAIDEEFGKKYVGASYTPEKIVKGITKYFGNMATIQISNLQRLYKLANEAFALSNMETSDEVKRLEVIKKGYDAWAKSKGLKDSNYFDILAKKDKNQLIDKYDRQFYDKLKTAIAKKDFDWIVANVDRQEVIKKINEKLEKEIDRILSTPEVGTEEQVKAIINRKIAKVKNTYDVSTTTSPGWLMYEYVSNPTDEWLSDEWKELTKPENAPAKEFYDYIVERNEYYKSIGYLNNKAARNFLPWVRQGFVEGLMMEGKGQNVTEAFLRNISVDETDIGYGQIDPVTGKPIDTIPIHFVQEFDGAYSKDLFKTMALYNDHAIRFKNLSDIEEQAQLLLRAERNKKSIRTSMFGKVQKEGDNDFKFNDSNDENSKLFESFMKAVVYQQKYVNNDEFDIILSRISGFGKTLNKKLGINIFPENMETRNITLNKSIDQMNRLFQLNALGFNGLSAISNLFGGSTNALINSGKYFTKEDYLKVQGKFLWEKLQGDADAGKILAAVNYFVPFVDNYNREAGKNLSLNSVSPEAIQDLMMVLLRKGDEMIQYMNAFAFLNSTIVVDGEVKNVREYLRSTPEYEDFYAGSSEERAARKTKFEEDVKKLLDEKGLMKVAKFEKGGEFEIPGVDRKSKSVIELRRIIQQFTSDALGSLTEENRRLINMNVYGSSLMVFKNWIPRLVDVRVGGLKYNAAYDAYEWGRYRTLYSMMIPDILKSIKSLTSAVTGNGDAWIEQVRAMYEKQAKDYKDNTGKTLDMTESEFIALVNQNIKNQALDLVILTTLLAIHFAAKAAAPDDDEDPNVKNAYRFMLKATDKISDEILYFYDPMTPFNLVSTNSFFPSIGLLKNYGNLLKDFALENYGMVIGDEEIVDDAKPIKYLMKSFPITSQMASYLPMFYPELAKDLGIKMQSTYGVR